MDSLDICCWSTLRARFVQFVVTYVYNRKPLNSNLWVVLRMSRFTHEQSRIPDTNENYRQKVTVILETAFYRVVSSNQFHSYFCYYSLIPGTNKRSRVPKCPRTRCVPYEELSTNHIIREPGHNNSSCPQTLTTAVSVICYPIA